MGRLCNAHDVVPQTSRITFVCICIHRYTDRTYTFDTYNDNNRTLKSTPTNNVHRCGGEKSAYIILFWKCQGHKTVRDDPIDSKLRLVSYTLHTPLLYVYTNECFPDEKSYTIFISEPRLSCRKLYNRYLLYSLDHKNYTNIQRGFDIRFRPIYVSKVPRIMPTHYTYFNTT